MKLVVTGSSGFVGQNLSSFFKNKEYQVVDLSLRGSDWQNNIPINGDAILHLAGKAHDMSNVSNPEEYFKINRDLTIELFNQFINSHIKDFFFFSSVKAVADSVDGILDESLEQHPMTPYGISKLRAEEYLLSKKLPMGKRLFIIRPCMIHGPGNKGNLNLLYNVVKKGIPWPLASFNNQRSFLSIDNLSFLIDEMLTNPYLESGVFNFSDDTPLSTNDVVGLIAESLGIRRKLLHIPQIMIRSIAKLGDIVPLPLSSERLKKLTESYIVSNAKIKAELKIEKLPYTAEEGLIKTFNSFQLTQK